MSATRMLYRCNPCRSSIVLAKKGCSQYRQHNTPHHLYLPYPPYYKRSLTTKATISSVESSRMTLQQPLVWIDLETTGLHVEKDCILEVACIVTDGSLQTIHEGENLVIHRSKEVLRQMSEWCIHQHGESGLIEACLNSKLTIEEAEEQLLQFVLRYVPDKNVGILAGSSVHFDKEFLRKEMPRLFSHLHYRIVDVTTVGELVKRWFPTVMRRRPRKQGHHRALDDIRDSIRELAFYKDTVFRER